MRGRWEARVYPSLIGGPPRIEIEYAGRPFASIFPTQAHGPGLQIVSRRLDFSKGMVAESGQGPQPFLVLKSGGFEELPTGPAPWIVFNARPKPLEGG